jgi:long-chain acyl-CoA synthetase
MATINRLILNRMQTSHKAHPTMFFMEGERQVGLSWNDAKAQILKIAASLVALGIKKGDRVAILGEPHPTWIFTDMAVLLLGGITVGIYPTLTVEQVSWQLQHSQASLLIVDSKAQEERLKNLGRPLYRWDALPEGATSVTEAWLMEKAAEIQPSDPATLVYTSGTTGNPKGAILTHGAFHHVVLASIQALPLGEGESSICFLPLAHVLQRIGVYRALVEEISAYFCQKVEQVIPVLPQAKPSVLLSVPRMLEKIKAGIEGRVAEAPKYRQKLFALALEVGKERSRLLEQGKPVGRVLALKYQLASKVFAKIHERMGGRLRLFATGGAALNPEVARFFHAIGIQVLEAWGLTETCAPATMNVPERFRFGTVGMPISGTEVKLSPEDGEILVKGSGLFAGYWEDPEATAAAFDKDGWFKTGDIGVMEDGFLKIVDRKKEILVLASGKNIPPVNIEQKLQGGAIAQAVVIGEGKPYLVALFAPEPGVVLSEAEKKALAEARVLAANQTLAPFEQVKKWAWLPEPLTPEAGLLTPTLKLRRKPIAAQYSALISSLYS